MQPLKDLYILILNYNSYQKTISLFDTLHSGALDFARVIVIDNNSSNLSKEQLQEHIPKEQLILLNENKGYASGNNKGILKAIEDKTKAVFILNPDINITPNTVESLYKKLQNLPNVGAIGTRICYRNKPEIIYSDGGLINKEMGFHTYHLNSGKSIYEVQSKSLNKVDYVNGSVFMVKTEVFEKVGLMIESFFLYFEETEWCLRAKSQGFELYVDPSLTAYHLSSPKNKRYHFYMTRNRLWLAKKYPKYYKKTRQILKVQIINKIKSNIKKLKLQDKILFAKLKGYILGIMTQAK